MSPLQAANPVRVNYLSLGKATLAGLWVVSDIYASLRGSFLKEIKANKSQ